jgi:Double zinc ribbon
MSTKKKLITRMAVWTGAILAVALLTGGVCLALLHVDEERWRDEQKRERQQVVERSRQYLGELAKKVDKLPVNPTLVGEIEARYFEERTGGALHVWAMGTGGEFLFGVPKELFSRLNAVYDREITPRLKEGVFFDRQAFLLGHLDEGDDLGLPDELTGDGQESADVWARLRRHEEDRSGRTFVLSAPLKTAEGVALGSLYLKRQTDEREWYRHDKGKEVIATVAAGVGVVSFIFLWILLPTWVYVDGTERGVRRALLFAFLTVISSLIGLVVYLISRPEGGKALACPGCGREVNGGAFCPHCGRDLSAAFCATCRYPLKPEWAFCPSCRTETKAPPLVVAEAPAGG